MPTINHSDYLQRQGYEWQACGWVASEQRVSWLRRTYAAHLSADACDLLTRVYAMGAQGLHYTKKDARAVKELLDADYIRMSFYAAHIWVLPSAESCISLITPEPPGSFRIIKWDGFPQE